MKTQPSLPMGWMARGSKPNDYQIGVDANITCRAKKSAYIKSVVKASEGFGALVQEFSAEKFRGKKLCFSTRIKLNDVKGRAALWVNVESITGASLVLDNMHDRPLLGSFDWTEFEIVVPVPENSEVISFGGLLGGSGCVWFDGFDWRTIDSTEQTEAIDVQPREISTDAPLPKTDLSSVYFLPEPVRFREYPTQWDV